MLGAIIGDIVGSRFEFNNLKSKQFDLFTPECSFTDDSVMTLAVAKAICQFEKITDYDAFKNVLIKTMHEVGKKYPRCGFGGNFYRWIMQEKTEAYNSFGNGSAMRVSPAGWYAKSLEEAEALAKATAEVTHNHPEGIKGAVSVAGLIFLAKSGATKNELSEYAKKFYDIDFTLDEIRSSYRFYEICQKSVPQAIVSFLEADSFEDTIKNAVSIGGDSDTIAAIAGSVAEAFYGVPENIENEALKFLDIYLKDIYSECKNKIKRA